MKALERYFMVDNFFDFVTVLPVYDYMTQPFRSRASLWLAGFAIAFALVALFPSHAVRMAGLIVVKRRKDGGSDIQATEAGRAYAARIIASAAAHGRLFK